MYHISRTNPAPLRHGQSGRRQRGARLLAVGASTAVMLTTTGMTGSARAEAPTAAHQLADASHDRGLFGAQDPTFDGAYRQGLAMLGLAAVNRSIPVTSVRWLLRQQCPDGSFMPYRADTDQACPATPVNWVGKDSNSTAMAAMALTAAGTDESLRSGVRTSARQAATKARGYLRATQNPDGGFPFFDGQASDVNSTGLVLQALQRPATPAVYGRASLQVATPARSLTAKAHRYLRHSQLRCQAPASDRGLFPFQPGGAADSAASGQATLGLVSTLPGHIRNHRVALTPIRCSAGATAGSPTLNGSGLAALRRTLRAHGGTMPASFGTDWDVSATTWSVIALTVARNRDSILNTAMRRLRGATATFISDSPDGTRPGAVGTLMLAAGVRNADATDFGGVNLPRRLLKTLR